VLQMNFVLSFLLLMVCIWVIVTHMLPLSCTKIGRRFKTFLPLPYVKMKGVSLCMALKSGYKKKKKIVCKKTMLLKRSTARSNTMMMKNWLFLKWKTEWCLKHNILYKWLCLKHKPKITLIINLVMFLVVTNMVAFISQLNPKAAASIHLAPNYRNKVTLVTIVATEWPLIGAQLVIMDVTLPVPTATRSGWEMRMNVLLVRMASIIGRGN
jgi:hypothetical protein